ncbi:unnamed protein product, partial [marine sediment metagenome]
LLDVSRLTKNRIEFDFVTHDLNQSIQDVVNSIRSQIAKKHQNLHLDVSPGPLLVKGDVTRLKQAMANLLDNASKYTPDEGDIWLATGRQNDHVYFSIRDAGFGIAQSALESIFGLFYQVRQPSQRKTSGIGVGLFLVDQIVRAHQGKVVAESGGLDHGSCFTIRIPAASVLAVESAKTMAPEFAGRHVILVEDNSDSRQSLAKLLKKRGFQVKEFADAESVSGQLAQLAFDVGIIDVGLPGKSGLELARDIRQI